MHVFDRVRDALILISVSVQYRQYRKYRISVKFNRLTDIISASISVLISVISVLISVILA